MTDPNDFNFTPPALWKRVLFVVAALAFMAFWVWALLFSPREGVNRVEDRAWAEQAENICAAAEEARLELADYTVVDEVTPELVRERADIVDAATVILRDMIDDIEALPLDGEKGQAIVPQWIADWRTYLNDRDTHVAELRETGERSAFFETRTDENLPLSEKVETFAVENEMRSCAPPRDLSS